MYLKGGFPILVPFIRHDELFLQSYLVFVTHKTVESVPIDLSRQSKFSQIHLERLPPQFYLACWNMTAQVIFLWGERGRSNSRGLVVTKNRKLAQACKQWRLQRQRFCQNISSVSPCSSGQSRTVSIWVQSHWPVLNVIDSTSDLLIFPDAHMK